MNGTGKNIVNGFRELQKFCRSVSLMLTTANGMMEERGWTRISKKTPAVEHSGDLENWDCWLPDAFFCFYEHPKYSHLLPFIVVNVDDPYGEKTRVTEALVSAGWLDYGAGKKAVDEWGKDYEACYSHLWMEDGKASDDGTLYSSDARTVWDNEKVSAGATKVTTFAYPLVKITDSKALKEKIVQRILDKIAEGSTQQSKKARKGGK